MVVCSNSSTGPVEAGSFGSAWKMTNSDSRPPPPKPTEVAIARLATLNDIVPRHKPIDYGARQLRAAADLKVLGGGPAVAVRQRSPVLNPDLARQRCQAQKPSGTLNTNRPTCRCFCVASRDRCGRLLESLRRKRESKK